MRHQQIFVTLSDTLATETERHWRANDKESGMRGMIVRGTTEVNVIEVLQCEEIEEVSEKS